jgi:glyoxylase-like metal-dependent hydrolase (beta-lactamase superfamily II)
MSGALGRVLRVAVVEPGGLYEEVWLLNCDGGLIMVDVGSGERFVEKTGEVLSAAQKSWGDVKLVILTHLPSQDGAGTLGKVLELSGHPELLVGDGSFDEMLARAGVKPDMGLEGGDLIGACGGIEVISAPDQPARDLCLYLREERIMIGGNTIGVGENGELSIKAVGDDAAERKLLALRLLDYDFDILLTSHCEPLTLDVKAKIRRLVAEP